MKKKNKLPKTSDDLPFTIQHFYDDKSEAVVKLPALGRMRLWESVSPMDNRVVDDVLKTLRHSMMALPFMPAAAFAADMQTKSWDKLAGKVAESIQEPLASAAVPQFE